MKKPATINFDKIVLDAIDKKAKLNGSNKSNLINNVCRTIFLTDHNFHKEMAKHHYLKMQEHQYLAEQSKAIKYAVKNL